MYRVVIDDERTFAFDAVHIRNSKKAIDFLLAETGHIDELWLDHDLGGDDTIVKVVDMLCEMAFLGTPLDVGEIIVHTQNPVGAKMMVLTLDNYGYAVSRKPLPEMERN